MSLIEEFNKIRGERSEDYGPVEGSFQTIANFWNTYLESAYGEVSNISAHDVGIMMSLLKVARTIGGTDSRDTYVDMANYAMLAGEIKLGK